MARLIALTAGLQLVLVFLQNNALAQEKLLKPMNLGAKINTSADETDPYLAADGYRLLFSSNSTGDFDLMVAVRKDLKGAFTQVLPLAPFNTKDADERNPLFLPNKDFYFSSNRIPDEKFKDLKNFDLFLRTGSAATARLLLINTKEDEMSPWITANRAELYFNRKTKDGWRICVTKGPALGAADEGMVIDSIPAGFTHPTLTPDGLTMYLQGPLDKDRQGIFVTTRKKFGSKWAAPAPVKMLNHPDAKRDAAPSLSARGNILFFASDRPGGQGGLDLWAIAASKLK